MKKTFGATVAELRKKAGMTQLELAEKMGVTDKAVSKWERDLSYPDVSTIPKLAELFNVTTDQLMQANTEPAKATKKQSLSELIPLILKGVAAAAGIEVVVLSLMNQIVPEEAVKMLGIGLACLAISQLPKNEK